MKRYIDVDNWVEWDEEDLQIAYDQDDTETRWIEDEKGNLIREVGFDEWLERIQEAARKRGNCFREQRRYKDFKGVTFWESEFDSSKEIDDLVWDGFLERIEEK